MFGEFVPEAVAGILAAPVGVMDERALGLRCVERAIRKAANTMRRLIQRLIDQPTMRRE